VKDGQSSAFSSQYCADMQFLAVFFGVSYSALPILLLLSVYKELMVLMWSIRDCTIIIKNVKIIVT